MFCELVYPLYYGTLLLFFIIFNSRLEKLFYNPYIFFYIKE